MVNDDHWGLRLARKLAENGWSVPLFAERMGRKGDRALIELLAKYVKGEVDNPRGDMMAQLARAAGMSEDELRNGPPQEAPQIEDGAPNGAIYEVDFRSPGKVVEGIDSIKNADRIKAAIWVFPPNFIQNELRTVSSRVVIFVAQGDSMTPTISPGERVVIDTQHNLPTSDGIYALNKGLGPPQIKRLQVMLGAKEPTVMIISDNPRHVPENVSANDLDIFGRVICVLRLF